MNDFLAPLLLDWYARCGRDLPWRRTRDAYRIWLSEVILQQTRVAQGAGYYERFTERFPDVAALAAADEDEVLKLWQGLGYYSRARNLHAAAREVAGRWGGVFPRTFAGLRSLPGVGDYTAAAVASIAFGQPCAAVDGNVCRVLSRLFDVDEAVDTAAGRRLFAELAAAQLDRAHPGRYNQAIMDFGALQCTPHKPRCCDCPLAERCLSLAAGTVGDRPVKRGRTKVSERWFHYLDISCGGLAPLCRREGSDIWRGLYEFPMIETSGPAAFGELAQREEFRRWVGADWLLTGRTDLPPHRLTHRVIHAAVYRIETRALTAQAAAAAVPTDRLGDYAVPRLLERYLMR